MHAEFSSTTRSSIRRKGSKTEVQGRVVGFPPGKVSADAKTERFFSVMIGFPLGYFEETVEVNQI